MDFRRLRPWILIASLVGNGFLIGVLVANGPGHQPGPPPPYGIIERMAEVLPADDARILKQAAADQGLAAGPDDDMGAFHRRTQELMRAETFDAAAFRQLIAEFSSKREQAGDRIGKTLIDALPRMSWAGRRALADQPPPGGGPR
ncbi:periplasmic heavy metal sensor [Magnetospirillum sulfuroxidans]|uniref:Periplasmic heavy metal sensor n=1 Tax=Magnetospirillum sulfuroxidans TaxID=611300 RepID=A0ABS5IAK3_9PROT|nr:periplasmic heavy metal sensor [Magnetospirillum sulfuroxidans]MBR9971455.1 periplasmic heavy metal sensor [Magnetospirillum sulfuroxidans]